MTIQKGTMVSVQTTNGGLTTGLLLETYKPTFSAVISRPNGGYLVLPSWRIKSLEAA